MAVADIRVRHRVAAADNRPVVVAVGAQRSRRPVAAVVDSLRPVVVAAVDTRRPMAVAGEAEGSRRAAAAEEVGSSPVAGSVDQSWCLPGSFACAYSGRQTVVIILSAIVCLFASHSGNR